MSRVEIDRVGRKYRNWTVVALAGKNKGRKQWDCVCECGAANRLDSCFLSSGNGRKCRKCFGARGGLSNHPLYHMWQNMIRRCENKDNQDWARYGGRGITVCEEWHDLNTFIKEIGERPSDGHQIERKNNDLGYCKSNCKWATASENAENRSSSVLLSHGGSTMCISRWARKLKINRKTLYARYEHGWSASEILGFQARPITSSRRNEIGRFRAT